MEITSIEICHSPKCKEHNFYIFNSLRFFPDDRPGFIFKKEHLERKAKIESAVYEFENEYKIEGILYPEFIMKWWIANDDLQRYRENKYFSFRYQIPLRDLFYIIHPFFQLSVWTPAAKKMVESFLSISVADTATVLGFLRKEDSNTPYISHEALEDWNFTKGFTVFQGFRIFIPPLFFSHNAYLLASWYESDFFDEGVITENIHEQRLVL